MSFKKSEKYYFILIIIIILWINNIGNGTRTGDVTEITVINVQYTFLYAYIKTLLKLHKTSFLHTFYIKKKIQ
jgi:hypothetical protein